MTSFSRFALRLRRRLLRSYEIVLCALLLAMALSVAVPAAPSDPVDATGRCAAGHNGAVPATR